VGFQNVRTVEGPITQSLEFPAAGFQHIGLDVTCRSDYADQVAAAKGRRFDR
jgi:hypothetical protein